MTADRLSPACLATALRMRLGRVNPRRAGNVRYANVFHEKGSPEPPDQGAEVRITTRRSAEKKGQEDNASIFHEAQAELVCPSDAKTKGGELEKQVLPRTVEKQRGSRERNWGQGHGVREPSSRTRGGREPKRLTRCSRWLLARGKKKGIACREKGREKLTPAKQTPARTVTGVEEEKFFHTEPEELRWKRCGRKRGKGSRKTGMSGGK